MKQRLIDVLWLCGAGLCRLASRIEARPIPVEVTARVIGALPRPDARLIRRSDAVVNTPDGPLLIPSVDGRTKPWQAPDSSRWQ